MCVCVCLYLYQYLCLCMLTSMCVSMEEARRGHWNPWSWSTVYLWPPVWVLGSELRKSSSVLNY